ncbi:MAG: VCBS repeat-containing protein, partial [Candidatus Bathyarchaeota archaeon]|nr:VCBS repeat-containing protein [Candidatus Bathyarchaeota archaeon]
MNEKNRLKYRHAVIDGNTIGTGNSVCLVADINGNGLNDVVIGNYVDPPEEGYLVWYEYPEWKRHIIARANLEAGGTVLDVNGDGRLDVVAGQPYYGHELYWFENPPNPTQAWTRRVIDNSFQKYHDQAAGDVDSDGEDELLVPSQEGHVLVYYDIPPDPSVSPWPERYRHLICDDISIEGLAIVDLDGDDVNEVIAGPNIFKQTSDPSKKWSRRLLKEFHARTYGGYVFSETRVQVGDMNEDGALDLVMSEAESDKGRLAWFEGPDWTMHLIKDGLFNPHSLAVADFDKDGHIDVFVGEMGLGRHVNPKLLVYFGDGDGHFTEQLIDSGNPTHEAKVADIGNDG